MSAARDFLDRRTAQAMLGIEDSREFDHLLQKGVLRAIDPTECSQFEGYRRADVEALVPTIRPQALAHSQERMAQAERLKRRQPDQAEILKRTLAAQERDAEEREQGRREFMARARAAEPPMVAPGPREAPPYNPFSYLDRSERPPLSPAIPGLVYSANGGVAHAPGWAIARPPARQIGRPRPGMLRLDEVYAILKIDEVLINYAVGRGVFPTFMIDDTCWCDEEYIRRLAANPDAVKAFRRYLIDFHDDRVAARPFEVMATRPEAAAPAPPQAPMPGILQVKLMKPTPAPANVPPPAVNGLPRRQDPRPQHEQPRHGDVPGELPRETMPRTPAPPPPIVSEPEPATSHEALAYLFRAPFDVPNNSERSTWDWITDACGTEHRYMAQDILMEHGFRVVHKSGSIKLVIGYEHPYLVALAKRAGWGRRFLGKRLRQLSPVSFNRFDFRYQGKPCRCRSVVISIEASDGRQ
jgi:hypothetical protein